MKNNRNQPEKHALQIVAMGASAGGLEAFEQFFKAMPAESGIAFVLVSHLDPEHKSLLPELLQRFTTMKVGTITDGMSVQPNRVHIIPPNADLSIMNNILYLTTPLTPHAQGMPIDFFFKSLALDQRERAIGVILSGMGSDGSLGIKAIKEHMGMVMAQDEKSAKFNGMLISAVSTGLVDIVAPAGDLPAKLLEYVRTQTPKRIFADNKRDIGLEKVIAVLRSHTGHDFSLYKRNTLHRRVERRMAINRIDKTEHYLRYLQENTQEREILFKELLIGVTNFFRDPEAFEALADKAFPLVLKERGDDKYFRVWVPGCSSGEEAYSMAMVLVESLDRLKAEPHLQIQIFATDLDKNAIEKARRGVYQASIASEVDKERLKRFFTENGNTFQVRKEIRELVIFAQHDVIKDPPFMKLDILCCRNLLIYFDGDLQKRILPLFHHALRPGGILFLGKSENVFNFQHLFTPLDNKWKIFQRIGADAGRPGMAVFPADPFPDMMKRASLKHGRTGKRLEPEKARKGARRDGSPAVHALREELRATHEEFQSTNEELQSTNEELMTSKEEMQSMNEELMSVNAELQMKIDDLSRVNNDMQNLLNNSDFATVFLDLDLNIRRFTEQITRFINLIPSDVGRPLADIVTRLKYDALMDDVKAVIRTLAPMEREVETKDDTRYLMRITPYRTLENAIDGAVLTFADLTYQKKGVNP